MNDISQPFVPKTREHYLFEKSLWQSVLRCFDDADALKFATTFGNEQRAWVIRTRAKQAPFSITWSHAIETNNIPLLKYLMDYKMPCPNLFELVQQAADDGRDRVVVFFLNPEHVFYHCCNDRLQVVSKSLIPFLDVACRENRVSMVKGICEFAKVRGKKLVSLFKQPARTMEHIFNSNLLDIVKILVPAVFPSVSSSLRSIAATNGYSQLYEYCLKYRASLSLDSGVISAAARGGNMDIVRSIPLNTPVQASLMLDNAFACGKSEVVAHVIEQYPSQLPSAQSISEACKNGCFESVSMLPTTAVLPIKCLQYAVKSKSADLVAHVAGRFKILYPHFKYDEKILRIAVESGVSTSVMIVYEFGQYSELSGSMCRLLVENNCRETIANFHKLDLQVYCEETFIAAVETGKVEILSDLLRHYKPRAELWHNIVPSGSKKDVARIMEMIREHNSNPPTKKHKS